jgi:hypothetical protein
MSEDDATADGLTDGADDELFDDEPIDDQEVDDDIEPGGVPRARGGAQ